MKYHPRSTECVHSKPEILYCAIMRESPHRDVCLLIHPSVLYDVFSIDVDIPNRRQ